MKICSFANCQDKITLVEFFQGIYAKRIAPLLTFYPLILQFHISPNLTARLPPTWPNIFITLSTVRTSRSN
jgi:hypothetical protein